MTIPLWRPMADVDLHRVKALSDRIHPDLVERIEVFADRLAIFPEGSLVLAEGPAILGYAVSHPGRLHAPPPLDHLFGRPIDEADSYYVHDVAVAPDLRGGGHARRGVEAVLAIADAYPVTALISVYGTMPFWGRFGFVDETAAMVPEKLRLYGEDARYMLRRKAEKRAMRPNRRAPGTEPVRRD